MCHSFRTVYTFLDNALNSVMKWHMKCRNCHSGVSTICFYPFDEIETAGYSEVHENKSGNSKVRIQWPLSNYC